jgi:hypothetical protein
MSYDEDVIKSLDEFKNLDQATRDYYVYSAISGLDRRFAGKWVEKMMIGGGVILGSTALIALFDLLIKK